MSDNGSNQTFSHIPGTTSSAVAFGSTRTYLMLKAVENLYMWSRRAALGSGQQIAVERSRGRTSSVVSSWEQELYPDGQLRHLAIRTCSHS